ncbi:TetR/AcrR family transcriptional regulator [Litoribrevibacter albus]|uniref:TetR family transcriptional regulator n=1 Tax=Litoribrevibacter albus TaxID=1473156 RepID=A0AA37SF20_9GAMM|nr:TetR/AcrR family transcriptional regulator [Litoribrevibacter albus]GLQ33347.1 TetR family transcriptional regulator [Litoribrevibacter albus]
MRPSSLKKRQRYLETATELFLEQGYENTGLDQLIELCGGSKLTLYSYFGDKMGLLKAVVTEMTEQFQEIIKFEAVADVSIQEQLVQFAHKYLRFIYSPPLLKLCRLVITQTQNAPELVKYFLERGPYHSQSTLQSFLDEQSQLGHLQIENTRLACEQLLGALRGNCYFDALIANRLPSESERDEYAVHTVEAFLRSYQDGHTER